jgi:D-alanine-D-alanine ligase
MKKILVVFGGRSAEHDVSIITAHIPIIEALQAAGGYEIYPLYIAADGSWYCQAEFLPLAFFKQAGWQDKLAGIKKVQILFDGGLKLVWPGLRAKEVKIDVVFPAMHGTYGEDGSLMGLLRMAGVPFVGCDMAASAVAMDKVLTKQVLEANNVPVVPYFWFTDNEWESDRQGILKLAGKLKYPLFVKPVHLGSSIGITKVKVAAELENAIEVAAHYDDKILVEEGVNDLIEVTLPIMGNDNPQPALLERPLNKSELFDFSDKYLNGGKKSGGANNQYSELPAKIGDDLIAEATSLGLETFRVLGLSGISRVDMLIDGKAKKVYVNEVNTLPGSLYHHNWRKAGVSAIDLVMRLIELAEERQAKASSKTFVFDSDILSQVNGGKTQV